MINGRVPLSKPDCKAWERRGTRIYHQRNVHMSNDMVEAVQRYQTKEKIHSFSAAVRELIEFGLETVGDQE